MPTKKYSALRIAAASMATGVLTVGAALPVYAAGNGNEHSRSHASSHQRQDAGRSAEAPGRTAHARASERRSTQASPGAEARPKPRQPRGRANPPRHTPVTVCHRLGNGSYNLLTFDDSALRAHLGHDDIHPVPAEGCPAADEPTTTPEPGTGDEGSAGTQPGSELPADQVLGVDADTMTRAGLAGAVLGSRAGQAATATRGASATTSAPQAAGTAASASSGVLPETGAGPVALTVAAALGLLGAGAGLLARRRLHSSP